MAKEVIMPKFGFTQETAEIVKWHKHEGDSVEMGDLIAEVTTDKINMEVEAAENGILAGLQYKEGDVVPVAKIIAYIIKPGELVPQDTHTSHIPAPQPDSASMEKFNFVVSPPLSAMGVAEALHVDPDRVSGSGIVGSITREDVERVIANQTTAGRVIVPATPAARRAARQSGVPLETVAGSGPRGRVQSADVLATAKSVLASTTAICGREAENVPLTSSRRAIAERMQQSFHESPHIALTVEVDMTKAENVRKGFNLRAEKLEQPRITVTALLIKIVAWALVRNPYINASFNGDSISLWKDVNIGVATAAPQGLIVPVLKGADRLSVSEINACLSKLAERTRDNKLKLDDVQGGTFTISNLGMFGIRQFRAVINPPESAILAVGSTVRRPIVVDDQDRVEVRPTMSLTLSADHRVIDGIVAARFLSDMVVGLESPSMLLF